MKTLLSIILIASALNLVAQQEPTVNVFQSVQSYLLGNPNANPYASCSGLISASDGQGGFFAYFPSSGVSTNSTNIFKPSNYSGRVIRQYGGGGIGFKGDGTVFSNNVQTAYGTGGAFGLSLIPQTANTVLAGPASGSAAAPVYRGLTLASADFANQGTTTTILHGNAAGNPSFAAASLTADVSGVLPIANGGTGQATAAAVQTAFGIQFGTLTTAADGTSTNAFGAAFSSAPIVVSTPVNSTTGTNTVVSVTTTNFIYNGGSGVSGVTVNWIAIGAP